MRERRSAVAREPPRAVSRRGLGVVARGYGVVPGRPRRWHRCAGMRTVACLALLTAASVALRTGTLGSGYWIDEAIAVGIASHDAAEIPALLRQDGSPPLTATRGLSAGAAPAHGVRATGDRARSARRSGHSCGRTTGSRTTPRPWTSSPGPRGVRGSSRRSLLAMPRSSRARMGWTGRSAGCSRSRSRRCSTAAGGGSRRARGTAAAGRSTTARPTRAPPGARCRSAAAARKQGRITAAAAAPERSDSGAL